MAKTPSSGGSRWFMVLSLAAMLAVLIFVGLQMRKPASTQPANATPETSAPAEDGATAPPPTTNGMPAGNG